MDRSRIGWSFSTATALLVAFGTSSLRADQPEKPRPNISRLTRSYTPKFFLRYSPDGSHIAYSRHHRNLRGANQILVGLRIIKSDGTGDRPLLPDFEREVQIQEHASFSPNGRLLVLSGGGNDTGNSSKDTFVCELDEDYKAGKLKKLIPGRGVNVGEEPCFSPDGKQLAFVSISEELSVIDVDGKNKTRVVQVDGQYCHQPAWSPDGRWIAFASDRDGNVELYKVRPDGTELTRITENPRFDCRPRWSRDGEWILFTSNRSGNHDLYLIRPDGTELRQLTTHTAMDDHATFDPNGRSIAFVSMRDGGFDVYRLTLPADIEIGKRAEPMSAPLPSDSLGDLVAHFDFEEATSKVVSNRAGPIPLTLFGAKIVTDAGRASLAFDGKDDYAVLGNAVPLRIAGPLSLSLWVRPDVRGGNAYLISKHGWNIYLGSDLIPRFETRTADNSAWETLPATKPIPVGKWSMIAAVFSPAKKTMSIYVDGRLSAERPRSDGAIGAVSGFPLELGHYNVSKTQKFRGRIDELRISRKALTSADVERDYEAQAEQVRGPAAE